MAMEVKEVSHASQQPHQPIDVFTPLRDIDQARAQAAWENLLRDIARLAQSRNLQKKAFISYAWPAEEQEKNQMQAWLKQLQENLELAGIKTFFDLRDMQGNLDATMRNNLEASDFVISVLTPRFLTRAEDPKTNLAFEFNLTLEKTKANPGAILPILYSGQFQDVVKGPLAGLSKHLIYTIQANTRIEPHLVELSPLGLIPVIYGIRVGDQDYTRLLTPWRHSYLTRLPQVLPNAIERRGLKAELFHPLEAKEAVSVQVIHGAEGMGKTQLASQYAHQVAVNPNHPGFARWIFADPSNLSAEWLHLGELLGLELTGLSEARQRQQIRIALQKQAHFLIVFDGIENEAALKDLLPEQLSPTQQVLITTRSHVWHYPKLVVPPFTADETQAFFNAQHLSAAQRKGEHELAEALSFHPQALATAVADITSTGKSARDYCQARGLVLAASGGSNHPPAHAPQAAAALFQPAPQQPAANAQQIAVLEAQLENLEKAREARLAETAYKKLPALKNPEELNKRITKFKADREECEESGDEFPKDKSDHLQLCIKLNKELPDLNQKIQALQKEIRKLKGGSQANEISIEHGALDVSGADIDAAGSVRAGHEDNINLDGGQGLNLSVKSGDIKATGIKIKSGAAVVIGNTVNAGSGR